MARALAEIAFTPMRTVPPYQGRQATFLTCSFSFI
jgi:hypothetical protein